MSLAAIERRHAEMKGVQEFTSAEVQNSSNPKEKGGVSIKKLRFKAIAIFPIVMNPAPLAARSASEEVISNLIPLLPESGIFCFSCEWASI